MIKFGLHIGHEAAGRETRDMGTVPCQLIMLIQFEQLLK